MKDICSWCDTNKELWFKARDSEDVCYRMCAVCAKEQLSILKSLDTVDEEKKKPHKSPRQK